MDEAVRAYIDAVDAANRPLFDRIAALVTAMHPDATLGLSYAMPAYSVGKKRLHVGAWSHGVSFYGSAVDSDLAKNHPELHKHKSTLQIRPSDAENITDDEFRSLIGEALGPTRD